MTRSKIFLALVGGAVAGAAIGVMLAPDSGANTRERIRDQAADWTDRIMDLADRLLDEVDRRTRRETD